jgi:HPt (histidine-containing phosphotransfer) domain-containing protein
MTGGTPEGYLEVLRIYCQDAEDRLGAMEAFAERGFDPEGFPAFTIHVHALKSASASIGAAALSAAAAELEAAGRRGDMEFIQRNLGSFCRSLGLTGGRIREALLQARRDGGAGQAAAPEAGEGEPEGLLRDLRAALEAENIETIDGLLKEMEALPLSGPLRKVYEDISGDVLICEFPAAIAVIDAWLEA